MQPKIKNLEVKAFRGLPDFSLDMAQKSLIILGENGTGKSSIVEAIEFFFTGKLSNFEGEGTKSLSLQKHAPHRNFEKDDVSIKIAYDPGNVVLERSFSANPKIPKPFKNYFEAANKGTFILRRAQLLKFIASVPADRFRAIASILGIESLDNVELEFKRALEELNDVVDSTTKNISEVFTDISTLLQKPVTKKDEILQTINDRLHIVGIKSINDLTELEKIITEISNSLEKASNIEKLVSFNQILNELKLIKIDEELEDRLTKLNSKLEPYLEEKAHREISLTEFLKKGLEAIKNPQISICPFCGQKICREDLLKEINSRLETLNQLSNEASSIRKTSKILDSQINDLIDRIEKISAAINSFKEFEDSKNKLLIVSQYFKEVSNQIQATKNFEKEIELKDYKDKIFDLKNIVKKLRIDCQTALEEMGIPKDWKKKIELITLTSQIKTKITELFKAECNLKSNKNERDLAKTVYLSFSEVKTAKINEIYESITENVNLYYKILHPKDPHENIELIVDLEKRASTELRIESFGMKEDPRAFASEGHLDSLGLCIFLAFVKKFNSPCDLIILDDIVTTIDAKHRGKICNLLFEHFNDFQLIITTHDIIWYEQLCNKQMAFKRNNQFMNLEIVAWNLENGPIIQPFKPRYEKILDFIQKGEKRGAATEGRLYLEWLLKKIVIITKTKVLLASRYTVSDLFSPAKNRMLKLLKDGEYKDKIMKAFQEVESTACFGNFLLHDNPEFQNISIADVEEFCQSIKKLHESFSCPDCDQFLNYYSDMKRIRCNNPKCQQKIELICK